MWSNQCNAVIETYYDALYHTKYYVLKELSNHNYCINIYYFFIQENK